MSKEEATGLDKKSFEAYVTKVNKEWGCIRLTNEIGKVRRLSFGSIAADYTTYGGGPYGKIIVFSGPEHSGKTLGACALMSQYQKENPEKVCVYVDVENTLLGQEEFLQKMTGLDTSYGKFLREHPDFTEKYSERLRTAMSGREDVSLLSDEDLSVILEQEKQLSEDNSAEAMAFRKEMEKLDREESIS